MAQLQSCLRQHSCYTASPSLEVLVQQAGVSAMAAGQTAASEETGAHGSCTACALLIAYMQPPQQPGSEPW